MKFMNMRELRAKAERAILSYDFCAAMAGLGLGTMLASFWLHTWVNAITGFLVLAVWIGCGVLKYHTDRNGERSDRLIEQLKAYTEQAKRVERLATAGEKRTSPPSWPNIH